MLGGLALKRRWQQRRAAEGKPADKPNLVMGINVQVCWEKFANYWDVEMRLVPDGGRPLPPLGRGGREALRREHDRRRRDPRLDVRRLLRAGRRRSAPRSTSSRRETGLDVPVHVDGASGAFVAPFIDPDLEWDFRLPRVASINASGHKYGLVYPGVGWIVWRDADALPEDLIFWVNYLGDNMPTFALNFSRPGAQVVAQYYNFLRLGFDGYRRVQRLRARRRDAARRRGSPSSGRSSCSRSGDELPVFAFTLARRHRQLHRLRRLERAARARLAGARLHVPGEPRRTSPRSGSSSGAASPTTWPTCSSPTSSGSCRGSQKQPEPVHDACERHRVRPLSRWRDVPLARILRLAGPPRGAALQADALADRPEPPLAGSAPRRRTATGSASAGTATAETPGVFHSVEPAWNDRNLRELAAHIALAARLRAHPRLDRDAGPADELPSVPPRQLALDAQRRDPRVPRASSATSCSPSTRRSTRRSRARPTRRCSSSSRSRSGSRTTRRAPSSARSGSIEEIGRAARRRAPDPDDGRDDRRRRASGRSATRARASRGRSSSRTRRRHAARAQYPDNPRARTSSRTSRGSSSPSRSATSPAPGTRCPSRAGASSSAGQDELHPFTPRPPV